MLRLIRQISLSEFRTHALRYLLTFLAVSLGVAIFSAARSANSSLTLALRDTIDRIAGKAALQITGGEAGIPEPLLDVVRSVPGVRAAVPVIETVVKTTDASQGNILILGVDLTGDRSLRDYAMEKQEQQVADPLVFLAQPDSLILSTEFAARNRLKEDDRLTLVTALGPRRFTVRGVMTAQGVAKAFGGNIGVMDIYSAQYIFGRGELFDRIDVGLAPAARVDDVAARIQQRLGPGFTVDPPPRRGKQTESLMEAFALALFFSSIMALLVGLFLIFNAFAVSVTQRRTQIGVLRALGVTRRQIQGLFLAESALLGLAGSVVGLIGGVILGRAMMLFMAAVVRQSYGVQVAVDRLHIELPWVAASVLLGIGTSLIGAFLPARAAAAVDPALALQKGKFQILFLGESWRRRRLGALLLAAAALAAASPWSRRLEVQLGAQAMLFLGLTLLIPTFSHLLAGLLRYPMGAIFGIEGRLASDSLLQAPRRTSATVAALMFSLAFVISSASLSASVKTSLLRWVESAINPDLLVSASESLMTRTFQFPEDLRDELEKIPGVRQVDALRIIALNVGRRAPLLVSVEIDQYLRRSTPILEEGRLEDLLPGMLDRNGVLISNNLARLNGWRRGDRIDLNTPTGRQSFDVVGVQVDYTSDAGAMLIDRRTYKRLWNDSRVDTFELMVTPGTDPDEVRREVSRRFADRRNMFVLTNRDFRDEILRLANQFWLLTYVQTLVAIAVAVLGIINSLTVSITERKREIGVLRALGGERRRVRKAIFLEAVCTGLVAVMLGIAVGSTLGYYVIGAVGGAITGWVFPYRFPAIVAATLVPGTLIVCLFAAWYPSLLAVRLKVIEALAYE